MMREVYDKKSGAILFKKDQDSLDIEKLAKKIEQLESKISTYEKRIKKLESKKEKENS